MSNPATYVMKGSAIVLVGLGIILPILLAVLIPVGWVMSLFG